MPQAFVVAILLSFTEDAKTDQRLTWKVSRSTSITSSNLSLMKISRPDRQFEHGPRRNASGAICSQNRLSNLRETSSVVLAGTCISTIGRAPLFLWIRISAWLINSCSFRCDLTYKICFETCADCVCFKNSNKTNLAIQSGQFFQIA